MTFFGYFIPLEIIYILGIIFGVLILTSSSFAILKKVKPSKLAKEMFVRTQSWWFIAIGVAVLITAPAIVGTLLVAYISFVALRELLSIAGFSEADRSALFASYFVIPIQYFLAFKGYYEAFLIFIPFIMFIVLPFILVINGNIARITRSMTYIPSILILTVYLLSHLVLLYDIEVDGFTVGAGGLIIYLIMLTEFNDVFQFTWGKLFGRRKILPSVSPNKTWAGFIGGVITTAVLAYFIRFLTPLNEWQSLVIGLAIGITGFVGDSLISAIKRELKIKDTDDLIPGHGGSLDRLDSLFVTAPVFYHLLKLFIEL